MQRFFVSFPLTIDLVLTDSDIVHQLTRVLRSKVGDALVLFDGDGSENIYEIISISKKTISLRGKDRRFPRTEPIQNITLYQALPNKVEKIEYILEKGVEVGIRKFYFFRSDFSQKLIISDAKKLRLQSIAREALEQCGGLVMPEIRYLEDTPIGTAIGTNITLDTTGKCMKISELGKYTDISIWIGPEGGWSEKEREKMRDNGFIFARFSERVLRTETAGVVTAFALLNA